MAILSSLFRRPDPAGSKPLADSQWQVLRPPQGGCSVLMPGSPRVLDIPAGTKYWAILKDEHYEFALVCGKPALRLGDDDAQKLLAIDRDRVLRTVDASRVTREESISFNGFPGREVEIQGPRQMRCLIRVYLIDQGSTKRLYELLVGGFGLRPDSGVAARFFDSFHLDPEKPPR
jgi:hypothetical protein